MASEKGWYWVALGVFLLGLVNGPLKGFDRFSEQAMEGYAALADTVSSRIADQVETAALMVNDRINGACDRTQARAMRIQERISLAQAAQSRRQAAMVRMQADQIRIANLDQARHLIAECPRQKFKVKLRLPIPGTI
jgi:hypothetical protein